MGMDRTIAIDRAVALVEQGLSANKAAAQVGDEYGVSARTVQRWAKDAERPIGKLSHDTAKNAREVQAEQNKAKRELLKNKMLDKALDLLDRMDREHIEFRGKDAQMVTYPIAPDGAVRNYAVSVGILIDKLRLESGEATARTETISMSELDAFIAHAERELDSIS